MGVLLGLMRTRATKALAACSLRGQRAYDLKPFYRGQRITVIAAMTHARCLGLKTLNKGMNGEDFKQFLIEELAPKLWSGAVVVMDNLSAHKVKGVAKIIEEKECKSSLFIPLFSTPCKAWQAPKGRVWAFALFQPYRTFMVSAKNISTPI